MRGLYIKTHYTIREIAELVGLNKSTVQNIKARIDDYGRPLLHKQIRRQKKINEKLKDT